jgi:hypothetical protein
MGKMGRKKMGREAIGFDWFHCCIKQIHLKRTEGLEWSELEHDNNFAFVCDGGTRATMWDGNVLFFSSVG